MNYDSYEKISFERSDRILTLTMNRPEVLNATDAGLHEELSRVFYDVAIDSGTDVIVLTGAGRAFSAGGDIGWMQEMIDDPEVWERTRIEAKKIIFGMLDCEKPIIARVNGAAMGLGATLALFCDIIIAAQSAKIADPHVSVGLVAGDGGAVIWPQLIGFARAKEYLMTGSALSGPEAERIGLINYCVPDSELDDKVYRMAERLAAGPTMAIRWSKTAVNVGLKQIATSVMEASIAYESLTNFTADHQEAVHAFREKRKPKFTGA